MNSNIPIGIIEGKTTTSFFSFKTSFDIEKFDFLKVLVKHNNVDKIVLAQVVELTHFGDFVKVDCKVLGFVSSKGLESVRIPLKPGSKVFFAEDNIIKKAIKIDSSSVKAYIGKVDKKNIKVFIDLQKLLSKHIAVLAKTGAGKSYTVGVLLEEILDNKIPLVVIDPHGEYSSMKYPNSNSSDLEKFKEFNVKSKSYAKQIEEYSILNIPGVKKLVLKDSFSSNEILKLLPSKISNSQKALLFSVLKDKKSFSLNEVISELELLENNNKFSLISLLEGLKNSGLFESFGFSSEEFVKNGKMSIINLKGVDPDLQQVIVYKILKDLFNARKLNLIPPVFVVLEEAHNFAPEKNFGEVKTNSIVRLIASEGRKFGLGLAVISQRPARIDKNVLSQVNSQIILKVTNPNDVKAIVSSVEGITSEVESEIVSLNVGNAIVSGITDLPLIVNIRPRKSKHGGETESIVKVEKESSFSEELTVVKGKIVFDEDKVVKNVNTFIIPGVLFFLEQNNNEFFVLFELLQGKIVLDIDRFKTASFFVKKDFNENEVRVLELIRDKDKFDINELLKEESLFVVGEALSSLIRKGLLFFENNIYVKREDAVFENLFEHSSYFDISTEIVSYDKKFNEQVRIEEIVRKIKDVAKIVDYKKVNIVFYKPEYV